MNITCKVDQSAALAAGINAPHSTVVLDVDPATLTESERSVLAEVLDDGHDATRRGLEVAPGYTPTRPLLLVRPDMDGLRAAIARMVEQRDARRREASEARERHIASAEADAIRDPYANMDRTRMCDVLISDLSAAAQAALANARATNRTGWELYCDTGEADGTTTDSVIVRPGGERQCTSRSPSDALDEHGRPAGKGISVTIPYPKEIGGCPGDLTARRDARMREAALAAGEPEMARRLALYQAVRSAMEQIIREHGSPAQAALLERGLLGDPEDAARELAVHDAFLGCPLAAAQYPSREDLDTSCDQDLDDYEVRQERITPSTLTEDQMTRVLDAEAAIKSWSPTAKTKPVMLRTTLDHDGVPWVSRLALEVTLKQWGLTISSDRIV